MRLKLIFFLLRKPDIFEARSADSIVDAFLMIRQIWIKYQNVHTYSFLKV